AAGLLLTRLATRTRELGIRIALGADRMRLAREGLAESVILVAGSAAIGLAAADAATRALPALLPAAAARVTIDFSPDWRVAGSTMIAASLVVVLFSLLPLVHLRRIDIVAMLTGRKGRERRGGPDAVVMIAGVQVALALATLMVAALFVQSMLRYQRLDPGFAHERRVAIRIDSGATNLAETLGLESLRERVESVPGIRRTALAAGPPLGQLASAVTIGGVEAIRIDSTAVGPGYFEVLEIPLREGRGFLRSDGSGGAPVAIVNETFAQRRGAGVGMVLRLAEVDRPVEIVGIVADSKIVALAEATAPHVYVPLAQRPDARITLLVELATPGDGASVAAVREMIEGDLGPGSVAGITFLDAIVDADRQFARLGASISTAAALAGTLLSMLALWSILAATVARSKRELAIRMAIGARRRHIIAAAGRRGIRALAIGGVVGILLALLAARTLAPLLVPDGSIAWWALAAPLSIVSILAAFAAWGPVRDALGLHPAASLRNE
ncbi:MAG: FtsX-like permease family protein, partial [Thermoanaerobaculia bacterium]